MLNPDDDRRARNMIRWIWRGAKGFAIIAGCCVALSVTVAPGAINPAIAAGGYALLLTIIAFIAEQDTRDA